MDVSSIADTQPCDGPTARPIIFLVWNDYVTKNSRLFLCCHFNHMFHAAACCVLFPPIGIQLTQCPCRFVILRVDKSSAVTSFETDIRVHRKYNKVPGTYAAYSWLWRPGCFLERGGGVLRIFKSPVCTHNQSWTSVRFT